MSGVLDAQMHIGAEATYNDPAAVPTRSFEALGDGHKRPPAFIDSLGFRAGMQAQRSDRRRVLDMGAEGSIELDIFTKGFGMLLNACFGATTAPAQQGATPAWLQKYETNAEGAIGKSLVVQLGRPPISGAVLPFTYRGGKPKTWEITQEVGDGDSGNAKLKLEMDYAAEDTATALAAPAYPASASVLAWPDLAVTVAAAPVHPNEFSVKGDNKLNVDRRFLRSTVAKKEPIRAGVPEFEGALACEFEDMVQYNRFIAGDIVPIVATWTGAVISGAFSFMLRLTMAACQFSGETPEVSLDDLPKQPLPYKVLWNGVDAAVKAEYISTDLAA